jgi:hypothetical protein
MHQWSTETPLAFSEIETRFGDKIMPRNGLTAAIAYFRTSSNANVGPDKDSLPRQRQAVVKYAQAAGYKIVAEYSDDGVKGADPVDQRPGFAEMMKHIAGNGVRAIIVETASRFARDLIVQETGWRFLRDAGITLIASDSPEAFLDETPTAVMIRQILGSVSQFEKAMSWSPNSRAPATANGAPRESAVVARAMRSATPRWWRWRRSWRGTPSTAASARCGMLRQSLRLPAM